MVTQQAASLWRGRKFTVLLAIAFAMSAPAIGVPAAAVTSSVKVVTIPHHSSAIVKNPHLKGVVSSTAAAKAVVKKKAVGEKATGEVVHRTLQHRWDYHAWITLHRGLGVIRGLVQAPAGGAMSSAKVWLKHPNGAAFTLVSRKHMTFTDASGSFTMFGVRAGAYRVVAQVGKKRNHAHVVVHPGTMAEASIKV